MMHLQCLLSNAVHSRRHKHGNGSVGQQADVQSVEAEQECNPEECNFEALIISITLFSPLEGYWALQNDTGQRKAADMEPS